MRDGPAPAVAEESAGLRRAAGRRDTGPATTASATPWSRRSPSPAPRSAVYFVNDVADAERDRRHPRKRHRPVASGDAAAVARAGRSARPAPCSAWPRAWSISVPLLTAAVGRLPCLLVPVLARAQARPVRRGALRGLRLPAPRARRRGGHARARRPSGSWLVCSLGALGVAVAKRYTELHLPRRRRGPATGRCMRWYRPRALLIAQWVVGAAMIAAYLALGGRRDTAARALAPGQRAPAGRGAGPVRCADRPPAPPRRSRT